MKNAWYSVLCEVDNGCTIDYWQSIVSAPTSSEAKRIVMHDWVSQDNETTAKILECRLLKEDEVIKKRVRRIA